MCIGYTHDVSRVPVFESMLIPDQNLFRKASKPGELHSRQLESGGRQNTCLLFCTWGILAADADLHPPGVCRFGSLQGRSPGGGIRISLGSTGDCESIRDPLFHDMISGPFRYPFIPVDVLAENIFSNSPISPSGALPRTALRDLPCFPCRGMFPTLSDEGFTRSIRRCKEVWSRNTVHLFPPSLDDHVAADDPVRAIDAHAGMPDLWELGLGHVDGCSGSDNPLMVWRPC